jgi:hypothetical protein
MMKRLTKQAISVQGIEKACCVHFGHGVCNSVQGHCENCGYNDDAWEKLAAYEDTGLEPSEIAEMKRWSDGGLYEAPTVFGIPLEHIHELVAAEREGRCKVLPCKVGDTVYFVRDEYGGKSIQQNEVFNVVMDGYGMKIYGTPKRCSMDFMCYIDDIGKTVFLTRPDAEAALQKGEVQ